MKKYVIAALLLLMLAGVSTSHATELVVNGDFENGMTGWSAPPQVVALHLPYAGAYSAAFLAAGQLASITQVLSTTEGHQYDLRYYLYSDGELPNQFVATVGGIDFFNQGNIPFQDYTLYDYKFTANSNSTNLSFSGYDNSGALLLDSVSVTDCGAPVPEPGTLALFGLGMAGFVFYSKRRQNDKV